MDNEFIDASEILRVCEAMLRVFKARGDYQHKQRNRMKFMIKELGWDVWYAEYERALDVSRGEYERLRGEALVEEAPYALALAFRIRYVLELDAREALHLIELRSGHEGHPSYRAVAHEMRRAIADVHPNVAAAMTFVDDSTEERLERLLSEMRNEARG